MYYNTRKRAYQNTNLLSIDLTWMKDLIFTLMSNKAINHKLVNKKNPTDLFYIPSAFNILLNLLPVFGETCEKDDAWQTSQSETDLASIFNQLQAAEVI